MGAVRQIQTCVIVCFLLLKQNHDSQTRSMHHRAVELYWQNKVHENSNQIISTYEGELQEVRQKLQEAEAQIANFNQEKERFQKDMRKAFMRGVCALNLEVEMC